ncbi:protein SpAN-like [Mya arenaria]|uniref:protein SpAN-like n=1 Tax=Mya arenaria TaxID=6604 RepID=UPI0022DF750F|nr:protein SpAN-like [Mya arenaria]
MEIALKVCSLAALAPFTVDILETASCGAAIQSHYGEITSPNYPSNYPNNTNCVWNITGPPGSRLMLQFVDFQVLQSTNCVTDFVQMYFDGNSTIKLCGGFNRWKKWLTNENRFDIFFKSGFGNITEKRGFRLLWKGVGTTFLTSRTTSWSQAQGMCSKEGGTMLTDDTYIGLSKEDLASQMDLANVTKAWIGRYYTPPG